MTGLLVDDLAQFIRRVDGDNKMTPHELGWELAIHLSATLPRHLRQDSGVVIAFVKRTNPDKRMGTGRLAELIVAEFGLDEEDR